MAPELRERRIAELRDSLRRGVAGPAKFAMRVQRARMREIGRLEQAGTDAVYYWVGGREAGEWKTVSRRALDAPDVGGLADVVNRLERGGYVAVRGSTSIGPPEGPPADSRFRALGL